jgi:hypothetical protein
MKSLMRFISEKGSPLAVRFDANPPLVQQVDHMLGNGEGRSSRIVCTLLSLPLYMIGEVDRLVEILQQSSLRTSRGKPMPCSTDEVHGSGFPPG